MHWSVSSLRMFWGWAYLPVCVVPPLLWGCLSKLQNWQVLNYDEYLMVYFLFLVGLWRRIVLKLINKQEISALCATSSITTELSSIYCYCYYDLFCSWPFASFIRREKRGLDLETSSLCFIRYEYCHLLPRTGNHFLPRAPGTRIWGHKDEYSLVPALKFTRHQTSRGTRTGRGPGSGKWSGKEEMMSSYVKGWPCGEACREGKMNF